MSTTIVNSPLEHFADAGVKSDKPSLASRFFNALVKGRQMQADQQIDQYYAGWRPEQLRQFNVPEHIIRRVHGENA